MEQNRILLLLLHAAIIISISTRPAHSAYYNRSQPYDPPKLIKTHLHFFLHDTLTGPSPSAVRIAGPTAAHNPIPFSSLFAIHDPLTEGPNRSSKAVGNAQGLYLSSSQGNTPSLVLYANFSFTRGRFKGSSLSVFSRNPVAEPRRELAVVGGRGQFRMARGTIFVTTHFVNVTTGDAILEYDVEVVHPIQDDV